MAASDVLLAVMGPTGSGKSTFVNLISGSELAIGEGLSSCTNEVQAGNTFDFAGRKVTLVDTPGFDDSAVSDTDILKMISAFLSSSYREGHKLTGIIYMHRISDFRVGGVTRKNFHMFRKLCGDKSLKNVLIVTTMWDTVTEEKGRQREAELQSDEVLFKPAMDKGASMIRHYNSAQSAQAILERLVQQQPETLQIQIELVDEGKAIAQTAAGEEINRERALLEAKQAQEAAEMKKQMEEAVRKREEEARREVEAARERMQAEMRRAAEEQQRLLRMHQEEQRRVQQAIDEMNAEREREARLRAEVEARRQELERAEREAQAQREELQRQLEEERHRQWQQQQQHHDDSDGCRIF